jgi:hypothetical protein
MMGGMGVSDALKKSCGQIFWTFLQRRVAEMRALVYTNEFWVNEL